MKKTKGVMSGRDHLANVSGRPIVAARVHAVGTMGDEPINVSKAQSAGTIFKWRQTPNRLRMVWRIERPAPCARLCGGGVEGVPCATMGYAGQSCAPVMYGSWIRADSAPRC
jgi:hypothetical protein